MPEFLPTESPQPGVQGAREDDPSRRKSSGRVRVADPAWYVLWTHSHCERLVHDQLAAKGFHLFLPETEVWSKRGGIKHRSRIPMFPGYLFLRHAIDADSHVEVCKARGLVRILGHRWDRLAAVPDREIEAIERALCTQPSVVAYPYLQEGQRVRIIQGPLADVEGLLVRMNPSKGMLVLSIHLLHRSVAVEVDCTMVAAV